MARDHNEERFLCDVNSKLDVVVPHRINIIKPPGSTSFAGFLYNQHNHSHCSSINACVYII